MYLWQIQPHATEYYRVALKSHENENRKQKPKFAKNYGSQFDLPTSVLKQSEDGTNTH